MNEETFEPDFKDFVELHDRIDRMKVALLFYANPENWEINVSDCSNSSDFVVAHDDRGEVAKLALKRN